MNMISLGFAMHFQPHWYEAGVQPKSKLGHQLTKLVMSHEPNDYYIIMDEFVI